MVGEDIKKDDFVDSEESITETETALDSEDVVVETETALDSEDVVASGSLVVQKEEEDMVKPEEVGVVVIDEEAQCEVENRVDVPGSPGLIRDVSTAGDDDLLKELVEGEGEKDHVSITEVVHVEEVSSLQVSVVEVEHSVVSLKAQDDVESEGGRDLKTEESVEKKLAPELSQDDMEIDEEVMNVEEAGQQQHQELEVGSNSEVHDDVNSDPTNPIFPTTQTVDEGEVSEMDYRDLSNSEFDIISHIDFDEMLYCSGNANAQDLDTIPSDSELIIKEDEISLIDNQEATTANVLEPLTAGNDHETSKSKDLVDSTVEEIMDIDQEVTLVGGQTDTTGDKTGDLKTAGTENITELAADQDGSREGENPEIDELDIDMDEDQENNEEVIKQTGLKSESLVEARRARYQLPTEDEGEFSVSDLVWGKVRGHPWWPGQIFDPSDASEKAMKYHKKDCFLVAYFGDQSFAWNEESLLKPFKSKFPSMENQSNQESFQNAVSCALEELSRRIMLGLVCPCIPEDVYDNIKFQIVKNAGIEEESSKRDDRDNSTAADSFAPDKLLEYIKALAQSPSGGADQLELVIAKGQLLAYHHSKGCYELPEFLDCGDLLESNTDASYSEEKAHLAEGKAPVDQDTFHRLSYHRRKHNLKAGLYPTKKEKSLSELTVDPMDFSDGDDGKAIGKLVSPSSGKKQNFVDDSTMPEGRKTNSLAKVSQAPNSNAKPSFRIGDCIRRAASQMTGSPSIIKANNENDGDEVEGSEYSSLDELLSQLHQAAVDPKNEKNFQNNNVLLSFFSDFRNSLVAELHPGRDFLLGKRKLTSDAPETFEFDDKSDTYWTDRIIHNGSAEQPSRKNRKRENHPVAVEKSSQVSRRPRKRYSDSLSVEKLDPKAPAELVMNFSEVHAVPSETKLNRMFRHFGPIKESQTEVDREGGRARLVFRRFSDAQVAYNSAAKFNIFGAVLVNYQLNHTITENFKPSPMSVTHGEEEEQVVQRKDRGRECGNVDDDDDGAFKKKLQLEKLTATLGICALYNDVLYHPL
ncbi:hypothetical protein ACFE04_027335 [Oxalis oulophora]